MGYVSDDHATATFSRPADDQTLKPFDVPERFTLVGPLGRGGQGSVWLAEGEVADDGTLLGMNFYVEGLTGDIPN